VTTDWLDDLSFERYRLMLRLLAEEDQRFLRKQPGFSPRMAARFRTQRCQFVRGYIRSMQVDFGRICATSKVVMVQSQQDRPDLASALVRSQITFKFGLAAAQFRLFLYRWGLGRVEVTSFLKVVEQMRLELRTFVPGEIAGGA
jgi:hypothetical protein